MVLTLCMRADPLDATNTNKSHVLPFPLKPCSKTYNAALSSSCKHQGVMTTPALHASETIRKLTPRHDCMWVGAAGSSH